MRFSEAIQIIQKQMKQKRVEGQLQEILNAESYDSLKVMPDSNGNGSGAVPSMNHLKIRSRPSSDSIVFADKFKREMAQSPTN